MAKAKGKSKAVETKVVAKGGRSGYKRSTNKRIDRLAQELDKIKRKALKKAQFDKEFEVLQPEKKSK